MKKCSVMEKFIDLFIIVRPFGKQCHCINMETTVVFTLITVNILYGKHIGTASYSLYLLSCCMSTINRSLVHFNVEFFINFLKSH